MRTSYQKYPLQFGEKIEPDRPLSIPKPRTAVTKPSDESNQSPSRVCRWSITLSFS